MLTINKNVIEMNLAKAAAYTDSKDENASCVFMYGENGKLTIEATNYQESFRVKDVPCSMNEPLARIAIDGKKLLTVIKAMKNDDILFQLDGENLIVKQNRSRFKMQTMAMNSITQIRFPKGENKISLNSQLIAGFKHVAHAIDGNNPQYQMSGALIETNENSIALIGTDGKRLAGVKYEYQATLSQRVIIPKPAITSMIKLFSNLDIDCYVDDVYMTVETETIDYTSKVVNGKYPEWQRIVPTSVKQQVAIDTDTLHSLVQQAIVINTEGTLTINDGELTIVSSDDKGESMTTGAEFDKSVNGIEFSVNLKFLLDFLATTESKTIELFYTDTNIPFMLKSEDLMEVIMPITNLNPQIADNETKAA